MKNLLVSTLETICPNDVYLQGTYPSEKPYPAEFITFWTSGVPDNSHYDNDTVSWDWNFQVVYYSNDPATIMTKSMQIISALKNAGFIPQGKGTDIPSDVLTHTGWAMEFVYTEHNSN